MPRLRLLGGTEVEQVEDSPVVRALRQPKRLALLGYLACQGGFVARSALIALLWPESDEEHGRAGLRKSLHAIRKGLGEGSVISQGEREVGLSAAVASSDVADFTSAMRDGELERAVGLYRGELLPGVYVEGSTDFEWWLERERDRLRLLAEQAALTLANQELTSGTGAGAARWAMRASEITPSSAEAVRVLMVALERSGASAEALDRFLQYSRSLLRDYGLTPPEKLQALADEIRAARAPRAPAPMAPRREGVLDPETDLYTLEGFRLLGADRLAVARRLGNGVVLLKMALVDGPPSSCPTGSGPPPDPQMAAAFLKATFRDSDLIARVRDREFVMLAVEPPGRHREASWRGIKARLQSAPNGSSICPWLSISIGYAEPTAKCTVDQLLEEHLEPEAENGAAERSKRLGGLGGITIFAPGSLKLPAGTASVGGSGNY